MENQRVGVYVCWCGSNIAKMVDVEAVAEEIDKIPEVIVSKDYKYMCSDPGQAMIIEDIKKHKLNRVVVSACSPRIHELTFRKALQNAGLNPYMFEMANIREHVSWVHTDRARATAKAIALVKGAVHRVVYHDALDSRTVKINEATLVIGGGMSGMSAALEIAKAGHKVFIVDRDKELGGNLKGLDLTYPYFYSAQDVLKIMKARLSKHKQVELLLNTEIKEIYGYVGNFQGQMIGKDGKEFEIEFGNIIVATGLKYFDPSGIPNYQYGKLPDVYTSIEFEAMLKKGKILKKNGEEPKNIALVHCVGSRNTNYHEYCSRVCCMKALKFENQIRSALPNSNIYDLYADMRAFGKACEELYASTSKKNVMFLMFDQQDGMPTIKKAGEGDDCEMLIEVDEKLSGENIEVPADMVILMVGKEAREDAKELSHKVGVSMCGNAFFIEKHPKLDPVATTTDGVYIIGNCQAPKNIAESVVQAAAAAARVLSVITQGEVSVEVTTASVDEDTCCGCQTCVKVCPYTAITFDEEKKVSVVNEILCKGCGTCGSACPSGSIRSRHFTDEQIYSQIEGLMSLNVQEVA